MKYTKPGITSIGTAGSAIRSHNPKQGIATDMQPTFITVNAYEADE
jgi:hypothetical protein